jgi:hypothetical protein
MAEMYDQKDLDAAKRYRQLHMPLFMDHSDKTFVPSEKVVVGGSYSSPFGVIQSKGNRDGRWIVHLPFAGMDWRNQRLLSVQVSKRMTEQ